MARYVVGVDGGQSSTLAVVVDANGHVLGHGVAGPSNHITEPGGPERCRRAVQTSVEGAVASAGLTMEQIEFVLCGMTGAFPATGEAVDRALPRTPHAMVHDSVTAYHGATGGRAGVMVIGGTGSVGYGENGEGVGVRLGGWGYLMGDEGSAYWIALRAAQSLALAHDERGPKTLLSALLPETVGATDVHTFHTWLYSQDDRSQIARLAGTVDKAAEQGDRVAEAILEEAGRLLADLAVAVLTRLGLDRSSPYVSYVGGVFRSRTVREAFAASVREKVTGARVNPPLLPPIGGAALLALRHLHGTVEEQHLRKLQETLASRGIEG